MTYGILGNREGRLSSTLKHLGLASIAAATLTLAGSASAATVSFSAAKAVDFTNWADTLQVDQFDPTLGTLLSVQVQVTGTNSTQTFVESLSGLPRTVRTGSDVTLIVDGPLGTQFSVIPEVRLTNNLSGFDGLADYAGTSGITNPFRDGVLTESLSLVAGIDDVSGYVGNGSVAFSLAATATGFYAGPADYEFEVITKAGAEVTVIYTYEPPDEDELGSIGDRVWKGLNADGVQDAGEPGLVGWTVTLIQNGTVLTSQQTGADGLYLFDGLPAGNYTVQVTRKAGYTQTFDLDGLLTPNVATASLALGEHRRDVDFGYTCFTACPPSGCGCTPGFWSNRGLGLVRPTDLAVLTALKLVDGTGADADFLDTTTFNFGGTGSANWSAARTRFSTFIGSQSARNMAAQLSRHLAAFQLNLRYGFISSSRTFRFNGQTRTAAEMVQLANAALLLDQHTPSGDPNRWYQECLKNILANANECACR